MGSSGQPAAAAGRRKFPRWGIRLAVALGLLLALPHAWIFLQLWWLRGHDPGTTAYMREGLARLQSTNPGATLEHRWVPYDRISNSLKRAVIAAEDQRFLDHHGFDVEAIEDAYVRNTRSGRIRHGGSTISQQLARNLFLSPRRTWLRKAREAVITMMIERVLDKRRTFEIYLNVIEWGDGVYGVEAAAQHYFGKTAADLEPWDAARLAAMIPSPRLYDRHASTPYLDERTEFLLIEMDREYVRAP